MESRQEEQMVESDIEQGQKSLAQSTLRVTRADQDTERTWRLIVVAVGCARLLH
jgi:hypothetical protein